MGGAPRPPGAQHHESRRHPQRGGRPGAGAINIIADVALGQKERAVLIQVGAQQLLIGVAPGQVNTLHVLAEPVRMDDAQRGGGGDELSPSSSPSPRAGATWEAAAAPVTPQTSANPATPPPAPGLFESILKRSLGLWRAVRFFAPHCWR